MCYQQVAATQPWQDVLFACTVTMYVCTVTNMHVAKKYQPKLFLQEFAQNYARLC